MPIGGTGERERGVKGPGRGGMEEREREEGEKDERQPHREDKIGCSHVVMDPAAASTIMIGLGAWVENWSDGSGHIDH